ncbi:MAG: hypothetical protein R3C40_07295 [Parvularculaceae bacterium]
MTSPPISASLLAVTADFATRPACCVAWLDFGHLQRAADARLFTIAARLFRCWRSPALLDIVDASRSVL